jgi:AraC-like DNA-binding protein
MPIYMDRHDVSDLVTPEHLANLHQADLKVQQHFGCKGMTYWFDDKRKTAFCLIEAPDAESIKKMHDAAHGQIPHQVIEVQADIVESFLGRIGDPCNTRPSEMNVIDDPAFRTIMVIKLLRSEPAQHEAPGFTHSFRSLNDGILQILQRFEGASVPSQGCNYLVSFKSVSNGVLAAFDIQQLFREFKKDNKGAVGLKIGLHAGMPVTEKKSIFEDTIKLAERMCEMVKGEVVLSSEVKESFESQQTNILEESASIVALTPADEKFLTLLMDYADAAWSDTDLKVDDFSKPMGCSKSQLYRKLVLLTGKSPNTFIKEYRLNEALKLLNRNAGNISEIAFGTGFSSPSYFSKCFQKQYGHLPSDYLPVNTSKASV